MIRTHGLSPVARTLLIPLYFRALESRLPDGLIHDRQAAEICARVSYNFSRLTRRAFDRVSAVLRMREFDDRTRAFLAQHPDGMVVHIGCGLDTRFDRVDNGRVLWYDLDLAEVIALRRRLIPETSRSRCLGYSVLDPAWVECLGKTGGKPLLLVAEGVLPLLPLKDIGHIMCMLANCLPGAELLFDAMSPLLVKVHNVKVSLTGVGARARWGLRHARSLEAWYPCLQLLDERYYLNRPNPRPRWTRLLRYLPPVARGVRILHYRLRN